MRQRPPSEETIKRMMEFLSAFKQKIEGNLFKEITYSELHARYQIGRSSASVCKKLGVVEKTNEGYIWKSRNPDRQLALLVLNGMLESNPNTMKPTVIPEFEQITAELKSFTEQLSIYTSEIKSGLKELKSSQGNVKTNQKALPFNETEQYQKDFVYLAGHIASGIFKNSGIDGMLTVNSSTGLIEQINDNVIFATKDLLNKVNNLKKDNNGFDEN